MSTPDFASLEAGVLARWQRERTFERSVSRRAGAPTYVFYDGPPFATGLPHYGHLLTSYVKDVVPRYRTMRGDRVPRVWGWDCHGLPVELEVEKACGLDARADVGAFNEACRATVLRYADAWQEVVERLGRWVDFGAAYRTMDAGYTDSVVWAFRALHDKGLVYEGVKVVAYCTRCRTPLSNFEAKLDDAYRVREDVALTVRFPLVDRPGALLAWTTTPWTLPANAALAVHPELEYVLDGDVWVAASAEATGPRVRGAELVGLRYARPFGGTGTVLAADWVTATDGTGVVHLAPSYGEDDEATCRAAGVHGADPVRDDGTFDDSVPLLAGLHVHDVADRVARDLAERGLLHARAVHAHSYPHCWRCDAPLVYRATSSWFVRASQLAGRMVELNTQVRWLPDGGAQRRPPDPDSSSGRSSSPAGAGAKRFADWLANARDWAVSRSRYWGAPVPVWRCAGCTATVVVGSRAELAERCGREVHDWHRPGVDGVTWACACGGELRRVPDVLDCWFESGAMPFASRGYPHANADFAFPGDFVAEYVAQTRGWFYTMFVLATALFDAPPFRSAVCHGVVLAEDGRKMSKRLRNYPDPMELANAHGSDALRAALLSSGVMAGNDVRFRASTVRDVVRRVHLPLWHALHLVTTYAAADGFDPAFACAPVSRATRTLLAEVDALRAQLEEAMDGCDFARAYAALEAFVTTFSTWHLRLAKAALWRAGLDDGKRELYAALFAALRTFARLAAPFLPFLAELVHERLHPEGVDSVHLEDWPATPWRDAALVAHGQKLRDVVRLARRVREQRGVSHRQPLREARVAGVSLVEDRELLLAALDVKSLAPYEGKLATELVLDFAAAGPRLRGRVKAVARALAAGEAHELADGTWQVAGEMLAANEVVRRYAGAADHAVAAEGDVVVALDLTVDEALAREALAREVNRAVQDLRKQARLAYSAEVAVALVGESRELDASLAEHGAWLREQCTAARVERSPLPAAVARCELDLAGTRVHVEIDVTYVP